MPTGGPGLVLFSAFTAVRQGTLHELTCHKGRFGRVRILLDLHGRIQEELVCGAGEFGLRFWQGGSLSFLVLHVCMKTCKHEITHGWKVHLNRGQLHGLYILDWPAHL